MTQVPRALAPLVAVLSGVGLGLAFEPYAWWWTMPLAVAGLTLVCRGTTGRRAFLMGLVFGAGFLGVLLPWLRIVGTDAWIGLTLLEALFYAALGWALLRVSTLPWWPLWQAALWVAVEGLRGLVPWGGFNWGRLAFGSIDTPVDRAVTFVGAAGVSFLIALAGALIAWSLNRPRDRRTPAGLALAAATLLLPATLPAWSTPDDAPTTRIAVVQGNVPGEGLEAFAERRAVLNNHVRATRALAQRVRAGQTPAPDLVIWPENSTDIDPFRDATVMRDISGAVDDIGVPTLVGAMVGGEEPIDVFNKGIVWVPGVGPTDDYAKMHPVPFGEYIPMREFLAQYIERLDQIPRDMVAGTEYGVLELGATTIGDVICFEVIYDDLIRTVVDRGAELLVVQTNNATYMGTGQVDQQFAISRLRALETQRYVAVAATNGISGVVDPNGDVVQSAPKRTQTVLQLEVDRLTALTPAVRFGAWVERGLAALGVLALLASWVLGRQGSREPDQRPDLVQEKV